MAIIDWNEVKNASLKLYRGICFEDIQVAIEDGSILDDIEHPNQGRYPGQRILIIEIEEYAYLVPYIETDTTIFLKTIIPSRKATKHYVKEKQ